MSESNTRLKQSFNSTSWLPVINYIYKKTNYQILNNNENIQHKYCIELGFFQYFSFIYLLFCSFCLSLHSVGDDSEKIKDNEGAR